MSENKANMIIEVDMADRESILDALMLMLKETKSRAIVFNDRKFFNYTLKLFGFNDKEIEKAWLDEVMNIDPFGLIYLKQKRNIFNGTWGDNSILIFPDLQFLIKMKKDKSIHKVNVLYDPKIVAKIIQDEINI